LLLAGALGVYGAAVGFDKVAHNGKTEAESTVGPVSRRIGLAKTIEDKWKEVLVDTDPIVANAKFNGALRILQLDEDTSTIRREFHGVRQKVPYDLL
jgi:hypothetical protein